jgi:HEAT repeat protein
MTEAEKEERDAVRERFVERFRLPPEFYLREMYSPSPQVRVEALRLLEQCLPLRQVNLLLPLLQDYSVDVREQARRTIGTVVNRYASNPARMGEEVRDAESLKNLLETFAALLQTTDIVSGGTVVDVLMAIGSSHPREFWQFFARSNEHARNVLCSAFLGQRSEQCRRTLLLGSACASEETKERIQFLLRRTMGYETARADIDLLMEFPEPKRKAAFRGLDSIGILRDYLEKPAWVRPGLRPRVIEMIPLVDASRYARALERCLGVPDPETVLASLRVASAEKVPGLVEAVVPHLKSSDEEAVCLTLNYLGEFGECDLVQTILALMESGSDRVIRASSGAVYNISRRHLLKSYDTLHPETRKILSRTLQKLDAHFAETLAQRFREVSSEEKIQLIDILSSLEELDESLQDEIRNLADDPDQRVRASAARTLHLLENAGDRFAVGLRLLFDEDPRVRANAVESLDLESPEILGRLVEIAEEGVPRERANAIKRLWLTGHPRARELFETFTAESDPSARLSAAWLCGEIDIDGRLDILRRLLTEKDPRTRIRALHSFGRAAGDTEIRSLTGFLDDEDKSVRHAARTVIYDRLGLDYQVE